MQNWKSGSFERWLHYFFDHNLPQDADWGAYFRAMEKLPYPGYLSATRQVEYFTRAFENCDTVFAPFSNAQVNRGLWHLMSNFGDAAMWTLLNPRVTWAKRERCVRSIYTLFERLFFKRCDPVLSYTKTVSNPLNGVCFMWWDLDVIPFFRDEPAMHRINGLCLEVMEQTLRLDSLACQESALHGLGHFPEQRYEKVIPIIERFIADHPTSPPELLDYAQKATNGNFL